MWLTEYLQHRKICQRKQEQRSSRIAAYSATHSLGLSSTERSYLDAPIESLVRDVHNGSTRPVSILRAYAKAAIKAHEATNCVTEVMVENAEACLEHGSINLKGPLAGIPVSLKDSITVGGFDTSVGYSSKCFRPHTTDGALVRLLKDAGAIPYVKTALPITLLSFESSNDVWGQARNPHSQGYSPGGSTGGEGAILAFGGSRIGVGSDVAGSVRAPAHFSGCYALRCSTGRWPKAGVDTSMPGQEGVPSVFSPMARTLSDLSYFTRAVVQMKPWTYDTTVHPIPWRSDVESEYRDAKKLSFGVLRTDGVVFPSPACERALETTISALQAAGHRVVDVSPPSDASPYEALVLGAQLLNADGTSTFSSFAAAGEASDPGASQLAYWMNLPRFVQWLYCWYTRHIRRDPIWAGLLSQLRPKSAAENWTLVARREAFRTSWFEWWNELSASGPRRSSDGDGTHGGIDVLLTPPNATPAVPHGGMKDAIASCGYTFLFNLLDYTAGVLPVLKVDADRDALSAGFDICRLNRVARGAYKHYDAVKMAGLPVGVQIVGRRLEEEKVIAIMGRVYDALGAHGQSYELLQVP